MKKSTLSVLLTLTLAISFVVCSALVSSAAPAWKFDRKIDFIVTFGVGSGTDTTMRPIASLLQDYLGVPVVITNIEGANGWNGTDYALKQPADGYTFYCGTQNQVIQYFLGNAPMDYLGESEPVCQLVHATLLICASAKAAEGKYTNFTEMIEYAKAHPGEISVGMMSRTGTDSVAFEAATKGVDIAQISYGGGSEMFAAMAGGHLHLGMAGADEVGGLIAAGNIIPLLALSENRLSILPNVECSKELGIESYFGPWRGIFTRKGTPQEAIDALDYAVTQVIDKKEWQDFLLSGAYNERDGYKGNAEFKEFVKGEFDFYKKYLDELGALSPKFK
ncbi:MAG: tripartite tricarboxylate transporter substrate binding protein [Synergistaceae bacterium]|nr:tripartite tricarboxylate transporter substrate binding protein [Synergistaceae bacterium]